MLLSAKQTLHGSSHYPSMVKEYSLSRVNTINTAMPAYSNTRLGCIQQHGHTITKLMVQVVLALMVQVADTVNTVGYSSLRCVEVLAAH